MKKHLITDEWLFDAKNLEKQRKKIERPKGQKCSNCKNCITHQYANRIKYCKLGRDTRTANGYLLTPTSAWCAKWEAKTTLEQ